MNGVTLKLAEQPTTSYFWGAPPNYKGATWPQTRRKWRTKFRRNPLSFVACIDLSEVHRFVSWLPESGRLLFFYDEEDQPWGHEPNEKDGWRVIHVAEADLAPGYSEEPKALGDLAGVPARYIDFESISGGDLGPEASVAPNHPRHQMGGLPRAVQGQDDMALMAEQVSNGLSLYYHYDDETNLRYRPGAREWRLLLQVDCDDDLGSNWGDCGRAYFWVRERDARARDFRHVWLMVQSY